MIHYFFWIILSAIIARILYVLVKIITNKEIMNQMIKDAKEISEKYKI